MLITCKDNFFHIRSGGESLLLCVTRKGRLLQLYCGHILPEGDYALSDFPPAPAGPSTCPNTPDGDEIESVGTARSAYPTAGLGDFRPAAIRAVGADGVDALDLRYRGHRILPGKPGLAGLPAAYASETEAETLEIELQDGKTGLAVTLSYTAFASLPVIACSVRA